MARGCGMLGDASRRHCLLLGVAAVGGPLMVLVGAMGLSGLGLALFRPCGCLWDVSKVERSARAPSEVYHTGKLQ